MNPTSFLFEDTLTPQCHCGNQPGGRNALELMTEIITNYCLEDVIKTPFTALQPEQNVELATHHRRNSGE